MAMRPDSYNFGNADAEWDKELLSSYLIDSPSFANAQTHADAGSCWIFSGTMGSGKTALRKLMFEGLRPTDPRLVLSVHDRLDVEGITVSSAGDIQLHLQLVLLLLTAATLEGQTSQRSLVSKIQATVSKVTGEMIGRVRDMAASAEVRAGVPGWGDLKINVGRLFTQNQDKASLVDEITAMTAALDKALEKARVTVFLDDVDELFFGVEEKRSSNFVHALLQASLNVRNRFAPQVDIRLFVKSFVLQRFMEDATRASRFQTVYRTLVWRPKDLVPLIAARLKHFSHTAYKSDTTIWKLAFDKPVSEVQTRLATGATYGPRDMINFCELARHNAVDRRAAKISLQDVTNAEMDHSTGIVQEANEQFSDGNLKPVLDRWRGEKRTIERTHLHDMLNSILDDSKLRQTCGWLGDYSVRSLLRVLVDIGFLGFEYQGRMKFATSDKIRLSTPELYDAPSYDIHPGFTPYLELR